MNVSLKIKIFDNQGTQVLQVAKSSLTMGSALHCDVVQDHASVSPEHARAWLEGGRIWVQDLGSAAGTTLNDIRLPSLKPMLVRELDILRLGQSESTLGLEALLVRAPVVKAKMATPSAQRAAEPVETKSPAADLEVEKRREEISVLGRELAELKLQLQMAKLDKSSDQEVAQQLQNLREEIKAVHEQKAKWSQTLRQMESEKQQMRRNGEVELGELKNKMLEEMKILREQDLIKINSWKKDCVQDLGKWVKNLSTQKVRSWATRPLSPEMIEEWETDLAVVFRKVILSENVPMPQRTESSRLSVRESQMDKTQVAILSRAVPSSASDVTTIAPMQANIATVTFSQQATQIAHVAPSAQAVQVAVVSPAHAVIPENRKRDKSRSRKVNKISIKNWRTLIVPVAAVVGLGGVLWFALGFMKPKGSHTLSSVAPPPAATAATVTAPAERRPTVALPKYEPKQNKKYRSSYTENVLYLENYPSSEMNEDFHRRWLTELYKVATTEWKLDQWTMAPITSKEMALIQDLNRMKQTINPAKEQEGIAQMRAREAQFYREIEGLFKNHALIDRFNKFKKAFYTRNQGLTST